MQTKIRSSAQFKVDANLDFNGKRITNLGAPVSYNDAATKEYVDSIAQGIKFKRSVRVASTGNLSLSNLGGTAPVIDGVTLATDNRVLVKNQTNSAENGIYVLQFNDSTYSLVRSDDTNTWDELVAAYVFVEEGTTQADYSYICTSNAGGTLGTTAVNWALFGRAGGYSSGNGIDIAGFTISVKTTSKFTFSSGLLNLASNSIETSNLINGSVTHDKIASSSIGNGLQGGWNGTTGSLISIKLADTSLNSNSNGLSLKIADSSLAVNSSGTKVNIDNQSIVLDTVLKVSGIWVEGNWKTEYFIATEGQTTFNLAYDLTSSNTTMVFLNGVLLRENVDYTVQHEQTTPTYVPPKVILSETASSGDYITVIYFKKAAQ